MLSVDDNPILHPAPPPPAIIGYHQRRASFGVFSVATSALARERVIRWKTARREDQTETAALASNLAKLIGLWSTVLPRGTVFTAPPQGASAPGYYFAAALARAVAEKLDLKAAELLQRNDEKTRHHPRASMEQSPFTAIAAADVVIVIDDLITSGTTMKLSLQALREAGVAAWGFAYGGC